MDPTALFSLSNRPFFEALNFGDYIFRVGRHLKVSELIRIVALDN